MWFSETDTVSCFYQNSGKDRDLELGITATSFEINVQIHLLSFANDLLLLDKGIKDVCVMQTGTETVSRRSTIIYKKEGLK